MQNNDTWFVHDFSGMYEGEVFDPADITISCSTPDTLTVCYMGPGLTNTRHETLENAYLIANAPCMKACLLSLLEDPVIKSTPHLLEHIRRTVAETYPKHN